MDTPARLASEIVLFRSACIILIHTVKLLSIEAKGAPAIDGRCTGPQIIII